MLRSSWCWDEDAQAPFVDGASLHNPPTDAAWQEAAEAAARASQFEAPPHSAVPVIECRAEHAPRSTHVIARCEPLPEGPEHLSAWHCDVAPASAGAGHLALDQLVCNTTAQLCAAITRDITQRLLREPATAFGQAFTPLAQHLLSEGGMLHRLRAGHVSALAANAHTHE